MILFEYKNDKICSFKINDIIHVNVGWKVQIPMSAKERILGTGERFNQIDQRGRTIEMWAEDKWCATGNESYIPIPFIMSSAGYGLLFNRYEKSLFDLGETKIDIMEITQFDAPLDLYFILKPEPAEVLKTLVDLWGHPTKIPDWALGVIVSRHLNSGELDTVEGIRNMVTQMKKYDLPWTTVVIEGWDTYDTDTYDDLKQIVSELFKDGKRVLVYDTCGRFSQKYWSKHQAKEEYFVRDKKGCINIKETKHNNIVDAASRRESSFIDITNPDTLKWWREEVWKRLIDTGIAGSKIDFCEQFPEGDDIVLAGQDSAKGMHHFYPVKYNIMMKQIFEQAGADRGLLWSRGGGIGVHKYPFVWCGDQKREFAFLKTILTAILSSGLSGIPFMGHDLAGYSAAQNGNNESFVFVRGTQLACFTATMETHGTVTKPYDFPEAVIDIYRLYSRIRYALIPYLKEQMDISVQTGLPLLRHMCLHYPNDEKLAICDDQFFLGEDMLVAPVLEDRYTRKVIFPSGKWKGLFCGKSYQGPSEISKFSAPLTFIPIFVAEEPNSSVIQDVIKEIGKLV